MEQNQTKKWKDLPRFNRFAIIFFFLTVAILAGILTAVGNDESKIPTADAAYLKAKELITARLKAPSTAKYPSEYKKSVNESDSTYTIQSYVDAVNSFNAPIRTKWTIKMKFNKDETWRVMSLDIEK